MRQTNSKVLYSFADKSMDNIMELLTIIVGVLVGALISNLPSVRNISENAILSARRASMNIESEVAGATKAGDTEHFYGQAEGSQDT
jgi:hypothetical protein